MAHRLDEVDKKILYYLVKDARNTSAPTVADEVNVSAGTIRNRISQLENRGVIRGYHAAIDYERADGHLTNLLICTAPVPDREKLAKQALQIPGVVNVRELLTGRGNLHITTVGSGTGDLTRIARAISKLGIEVENEDLIQHERSQPYRPFGPDGEVEAPSMTDFMSLSGSAEVVDLTVSREAPIAGKTLREADGEGDIGEDVLVVAIERGDTIVTPKGNTTVQPDDLVTVFSLDGVSDDLMYLFTGSPSDGE